MLKYAIAGCALVFAASDVAAAQGPPPTESTGPVVYSSTSPPPPAPVAAPAAAAPLPVLATSYAPAPAAAPDPAPAVAPSPFGSYSFEVAANLVTRLCAPLSTSTSAFTSTSAAASAAGFTPASTSASASVAWSLPPNATLWPVDSIDSDVYLYAYGPDLSSCGALIARPLPDVVSQRLKSEMATSPHSYAVDSESLLEAGVKFTRFRSAGARFADMMEYPAAGETPGLVKLEMLPAS